MMARARSDLEKAEANLAEAVRRWEGAAEEPSAADEMAEEAVRNAKAAQAKRRNAAHLDIVRERHPRIVRAVERGGHPALVRLCKANALVHSGTNHELIARLVNAEGAGLLEGDAVGRPLVEVGGQRLRAARRLQRERRVPRLVGQGPQRRVWRRAARQGGAGAARALLPLNELPVSCQ